MKLILSLLLKRMRIGKMPKIYERNPSTGEIRVRELGDYANTITIPCTNIDIDPERREWMYDGNGNKVYKDNYTRRWDK